MLHVATYVWPGGALEQEEADSRANYCCRVSWAMEEFACFGWRASKHDDAAAGLPRAGRAIEVYEEGQEKATRQFRILAVHASSPSSRKGDVSGHTWQGAAIGSRAI